MFVNLKEQSSVKVWRIKTYFWHGGSLYMKVKPSDGITVGNIDPKISKDGIPAVELGTSYLRYFHRDTAVTSEPRELEVIEIGLENPLDH